MVYILSIPRSNRVPKSDVISQVVKVAGSKRFCAKSHHRQTSNSPCSSALLEWFRSEPHARLCSLEPVTWMMSEYDVSTLLLYSNIFTKIVIIMILSSWTCRFFLKNNNNWLFCEMYSHFMISAFFCLFLFWTLKIGLKNRSLSKWNVLECPQGLIVLGGGGGG